MDSTVASFLAFARKLLLYRPPDLPSLPSAIARRAAELDSLLRYARRCEAALTRAQQLLAAQPSADALKAIPAALPGRFLPCGAKEGWPVIVKLSLLAVCLLATFCLAGCQGARETEDRAFVTALGIDRAESGQLQVSYTIKLPRALGSGPGAGHEMPGRPAIVSTIVAASSAEARNLLSGTISRFSSAAHLKAVIIGEELARTGVSEIIVPFVRYREYRDTVFVFVVSGTAEHFLHKNVPKVDYLPSKYYESMIVSAIESNYYMRCDIHDFYLGLKNPGQAASAAYAAVNPLAGRDEQSGTQNPHSPVKSYIDVALAGGRETISIAIFLVSLPGRNRLRTGQLPRDNRRTGGDPYQAGHRNFRRPHPGARQRRLLVRQPPSPVSPPTARWGGAGIDSLYRAAAVEVKVTVKLRRPGLMWRTAPLKANPFPGRN